MAQCLTEKGSSVADGAGSLELMANSRPVSGPFRVIVVDADPAQRRALTEIIGSGSGRFTATAYASSAEASSAVATGEAIVLADLETIGGPAHVADIAAPLIATSARSSLGAAVSAVKGGALDFLPKPIGAKALLERLEAAVASFAAAPAAPSPVSPPPRVVASAAVGDFVGFVGRSPAMLQVYDEVRRIAPSRAPVFITGESGTGKELTAEAIHTCAAAGQRPFVALNCSAIPKDLMESEIFGHVRGAFTGAGENRVGAAERANGGTLFLDEIAEMELGLQAKLLRFLQSGTVQRVGDGQVRPVDVRIVCATNRDPDAEVAAGRFRADLFYRLHVLPIHLRPLRERREDVMPLAGAFLARYAGEEGRAFRRFSPAAAERLLACDWPGNVRQLGNVIRRIVVLNDGEEVTAEMLPSAVSGGPPSSAAVASLLTGQPVLAPLWQEERRIIEAALAAHGGNIARAAAALEISPSTIYRKRQAWEERCRLAG
jgi:two-component system, repressor protein LuxO